MKDSVSEKECKSAAQILGLKPGQKAVSNVREAAMDLSLLPYGSTQWIVAKRNQLSQIRYGMYFEALEYIRKDDSEGIMWDIYHELRRSNLENWHYGWDGLEGLRDEHTV